jgi:hypothetical protein
MEERAPEAARLRSETTNPGTTVMNGKASKFASTILSALLFAQGMLGVAGVTLVLVKDRMNAEPVMVANVASLDAQLR